MHRNLDRRVEVLVRLPGEDNQREVDRLLDLAFAEGTNAWTLGDDGTWTRNGGTQHLHEVLIAEQRRQRS